MLFHKAMYKFSRWTMKESFQLFERAAAKGHEESIWIVSVLKDVEMEWDAWKEAFAKTEEPMGWYFAGRLSEWRSREEFDFFKKSAEGGCSWGQVGYGKHFSRGEFVEEDKKVYVEWLEKAASQNNPEAMDCWEVGFDGEEGIRRRHCRTTVRHQIWAGRAQCLGW
jgi:TPR repeat protein